MSSGSSAIDPIEFDEVRAMSEEHVEDGRRRGSISRRRQSRVAILRPHINVVRREAQDLYSARRRRLSNARQRSSGQQTETMPPRPVRMLAHGGHLTILLRLLPRNGVHQEPTESSATTIRMRIDLPESRGLVTATVSADDLTIISPNVESNQNNTPPASPPTANTFQRPPPSTDPEA